ncbi:MAG: preprotein translocase subunit SecY [Deltaproteobacteria bacterium]|nr:preprotein translocase subunit SecY [Deltaproteobacteria bacterium]MBW2421515.1 preprotein translocase subunit SecY [Deltaproteobacteria bacterium]
MIGGIQNIGKIPELRQRILFTFGMLAVYRVGCAVVTPGINASVIRDFFKQMEGTVFGLFNLFSGGALEQLSIFSLGIMPYISATIIFQLLTVVIPQLEALKKEGEQGQKKINQWSRYATIVLALFQSLLIATALEGGQFGAGAVLNPGWAFKAMTMVTLTTGTAFIMWLGEQVTERGIGNGISLVIFSGIVAGIPSGVLQMFELIRTDQFTPLQAILLTLFALVVVGGVVFVERAQRRIPIQHARRVVGKKVAQGGMSYFPLRVNTAGVIPPIFASSLLMFPLTLRQFSDSPTIQTFIDRFLNPGGMTYNLVYVGLIMFFCYFYTAIVINPVDVSENIKRFGGYIPGIRPGAKTAEYIDKVLSRLTFIGAVYVAAVCVLPVILSARMNVPFYFGGTALLICVGVALDTIGQIEAHLVSREYEGFVKGGRTRGRLGR